MYSAHLVPSEKERNVLFQEGGWRGGGGEFRGSKMFPNFACYKAVELKVHWPFY